MATEAYAGAAAFVGPLALSAGLSSVFAVVAIGSVLEGRTLHNLVAYVAGVAVTLGLNIVLALLKTPPIWIAWANLAGQATAVAIMAVLSQRVHKVPYPFLRTMLLLGVGALAVTQLGGRVTSMSGTEIAAFALAVIAGTAAWLMFAVLTPAQRTRLLARVRRAPGAAS
jgi:hypothetical protein